jgi:Peptidase A4 family
MQNRRLAKKRLWVEELEPRVVLSTFPGIAPPLFQSVAATSTNWSGYAAETNLNLPQTGAFIAVSGSWTVPAVTGSGTAYSSIWVGLDGFSSKTVEQIGTDSDLINGVPSYYAWFEMYPSYSVNITTLSIKPGDRITASVNYTGSNLFALNLADVDTGMSFSTTQTLKNAQRSSAEWIVEAPSSGHSVLPLANFGTASINSASASATLKGTTGTTTGPIDSASWQNAEIDMVARRSTEVTTSPLTDTAGTSSFTATFAGTTTVAPPPRQNHHQQDTVTGLVGSFSLANLGGPVLQFANYNQTLLPMAPLAAPNSYAASVSSRSVSAISPSLLGSSNGGGRVGVEEPVRNDSDVLPDLLPPIRRPQAPGVQEAPNREIRPAPTAPVGELSVREDTPPAVIDVREISRPDTPAETRELRTGGVVKAMVSLLAIFGAFSLFGEGKTFRTDDSERDRAEPT